MSKTGRMAVKTEEIRGKVYWNEEFGTYEYVYEDGYVYVFRDDIEARVFAKEHGLEFIDYHQNLKKGD